MVLLCFALLSLFHSVFAFFFFFLLESAGGIWGVCFCGHR